MAETFESYSGARVSRAIAWVKAHGREIVSTFIIKEPSPRDDLRFRQSAKREMSFYRDIAPSIKLAVPKLWAAGKDDRPILILEDIGHALPQDLKSWTKESVLSLVHELARFQQSQSDAFHYDLYEVEEWREQAACRSGCESLTAAGVSLDGLSPWSSKDRFSNDLFVGSELRVLCHGDLTARNVLLTNDGRDYVIDWQNVSLRHPTYDIATFVCESYDVLRYLGLAPLDLAQLHHKALDQLSWEEYRRNFHASVRRRFACKVVPQLSETGDDPRILQDPYWKSYFTHWCYAEQLAFDGQFLPRLSGSSSSRPGKQDPPSHSRKYRIGLVGSTEEVSRFQVSQEGDDPDLTIIPITYDPGHVSTAARLVYDQELDVVLGASREKSAQTAWRRLAKYLGLPFVSCLPKAEALIEVRAAAIRSRNLIDAAGTLSVVIPTYNRPHFVEGAIKSVLAQTYSPIEIVVVDDGSESDIAKLLQERYPTVRFVRLTNNAGKSAAINEALGVASGSFVWILDDDDLALPDKAFEQIRQLVNYPEYDLSYTGWFEFATGRHETIQVERVFWAEEVESDWQLPQMLQTSFISSPTVIARRAAFDRVGAFSVSLVRAQQYEYWLRVLECGSAIAYGPPTLLFRLHDGPRGSAADRFPGELRGQKRVSYEVLALRQLAQRWSRHSDRPLEDILSLICGLGRRGDWSMFPDLICAFDAPSRKSLISLQLVQELRRQIVLSGRFDLLRLLNRRARRLAARRISIWERLEVLVGANHLGSIFTAREYSVPGLLRFEVSSREALPILLNAHARACRSHDSSIEIISVHRDESESDLHNVIVLPIWPEIEVWGMVPDSLDGYSVAHIWDAIDWRGRKLSGENHELRHLKIVETIKEALRSS
ncbi:MULTISPECIES: glycosyltransferase [unclassified Bradyrhizobium]|uniref:glycosyltransferase n=1 Tax=unclassified Bradyrhizobium TaxID=2631580 RepID=UPI002916864D|nr:MULTISPECIES: glycosyltransferase [unclassified Bradyrhizobium]